tara:strand:- start:180 stop:935 length:756 start_codon:yes stop_codon:yes gene_type:complete
MNNIKIFFIIHVSRSKKIKKIIQSFFKNRNEKIFLFTSKYKGHTSVLTKNAIKQNANIIVACGGDGTINEIINQIANTKIKLGILPLGSGNGIAKHFKIPNNIYQALNLIVSNNSKFSDLGKIDKFYFLGNLGFGFENEFINQYQKLRGRGFIYYLFGFIMASFKFNYNTFEIKKNNKTKKIKPFAFTISNLNQQGYNVSITPKASNNDGLLDVAIFEKKNIFKIIKFLFFILFKIKNQTLEEFKIKKLRL